MAATITPGYSFGATELVTNTKLASLASGTIASIDRTNFDSSTRPITATSSDITSPVAGDMEYRTDLDNLEVSNSSVWFNVVTNRRLINGSGGTLAVGSVVIEDSAADNSVTTTTSSSYRGEVGVLLEGGASLAVRSVKWNGYCPTVLVDGAVTKGQYLKISTSAAGKATGTSTLDNSCFGRVIIAGSSSCSAILFGATVGGSSAPTMQIFTGNGTWTKPAGLIKAKITVVGGGGGGAGHVTGAYGGIGGGGGGTAVELLATAALGATETVTVGAGGAGGAAAGANNGADGGTTSFGSLCSATGGVGGVYPGTSNTAGSDGGAGSGGTFNLEGGASQASVATANGPGSLGGSSHLGGGGRPTVAAGEAGGNYGGGGAGGSGNAEGGNGAGGIVIVEEFY